MRFSWLEVEGSKQDRQRQTPTPTPTGTAPQLHMRLPVWGSREKKYSMNQKVWMVCLFLGFFAAVLHLTTTYSSYLSNSLWGWSESEDFDMVDLATLRSVNSSAFSSSSSDTSSSTKQNVRNKVRKDPRVAICLVGGARAFELTGLSIRQHVLDVYNTSDVFLHVPLDDDAHKLTLLTGASRLVIAKIFENDLLPESNEAREVLTAANSPHGIQGLLQYFRLVEGCLTMIDSYESMHRFKYDWIIRTRVDGYWSGPLPTIGTFHPNYYHVPYGSKYGGLNDRLGIGTRSTSWAAMSRLRLIPKLYHAGYRLLNSEQAFKHQLDVSGVKATFDDFRFCILTSRKYAWPLSAWGVPIASIKSKGALNGAKCKPCHPELSGDAAANAVKVLDTGWGWINPVKDLQLCDSRHDLEPGWETMFDEISGPRQAHVRQWMTNRTEDQCIAEIKQFAQSWQFWEAPAPEMFCQRPALHPPKIEENSTESAGQN